MKDVRDDVGDEDEDDVKDEDGDNFFYATFPPKVGKFKSNVG